METAEELITASEQHDNGVMSLIYCVLLIASS